MIEAFMAAMSLSATQVIECQVIAVGDRIETHGPERLEAVCPDAADGAQASADLALSRLDLNLARLGEFERYEVADTLALERTDDGWRVLPGQRLVYVAPLFPTRAAQFGLTRMLCALGLEPDETGRVPEPRVHCISERGRNRNMGQATLEAVRHWRYAPTRVRYCLDDQFDVEAAIIANGRTHPTARMPDPDQLPFMCEEG